MSFSALANNSAMFAYMNKMFQLLGLRNDDRIHKNGFALQELARSASVETQSMAYLSLDACANSRGTRILGFITLAYAPAAIVAVSNRSCPT